MRKWRVHISGNEPTSINILDMFWNEKVFFKISSDFQLNASGFWKSPKIEDWTQLLSVLLKSSFFNCDYVDELYEMEEDYGTTWTLIKKSKFMAMKSGLSASKVPGNNQMKLNWDYDLISGED